MTHINLEAVDTDGAIREAAEEVSGDTRLGFLRKGALAGGAAVGGGAILGSLVAPALASAKGAPPRSFGKGDIGILNFALTLEYLESAFYNEAARNGAVTDPALKRILRTWSRTRTPTSSSSSRRSVARHQEAEVQLPRRHQQQGKFAATAYVLENTGVHAYLGQAGNIKTPAYLLGGGFDP